MQFQKVDQFTIFGKNGAPTTVQLANGDLTRLPPSEYVDLLVISCFPNSYAEVNGSMIQSLGQMGIHLRELATDKEEDLRTTHKCWTTKPLKKYTDMYGKILCWEANGFQETVSFAVKEVFAAIIAMASDCETVAMPLLATGRGIDQTEMLISTLFALRDWVEIGLGIRKLTIVVYREEASIVEQFAAIKNNMQYNAEYAPPVRRKSSRSNIWLSELKTKLKKKKSRGKKKVDVSKVVALSYSKTDKPIANKVMNVLKMQDEKQIYSYLQDPATFESNDSVALAKRAGKVIALITPAYINDLACIEQFNQCLLYDNGVLEPILVQNVALPNYISAVQYRDARPGTIEKFFPALVGAMRSLDMASQFELSDGKSSALSNAGSHRSVISRPNTSFDIFISYSQRFSSQTKAAVEIFSYISPEIEIFVDVEDLRAGSHWQAALYKALDACKLIFIILTPTYFDSSFCAEELAITSLRVAENRASVVVFNPFRMSKDSPQLQSLPSNIFNEIVSEETMYESCTRVLRSLKRDLPKVNPMKTTETMHSFKWKLLNDSVAQYASDDGPKPLPKICVIATKQEKTLLHKLYASIGKILRGAGSVVCGITGQMTNTTVEESTVMVCLLSRAFLKDTVAMNFFNIGLLRNRDDGGFFLPFVVESLGDDAPSFVRLTPCVDVSNDGGQTDDRMQDISEKIVAYASMSALGKMKEKYTIVGHQQ